MKYKFTVMAILLIVGGLASAYKKDPDYIRARRKGAKARIVLSVVDDEGAVVPDAAVRALMGMNFRERAYHINGLTDSDGRFAVEGKTTGDEVEVEISKDGYYGASRQYCFSEMGAESDVKDGKWQPFGMEERLRLRKIRNPEKLCDLGFGNGRVMPATNTWMGLDMACGDFVKPHGEGVRTDFEMKVDQDAAGVSIVSRHAVVYGASLGGLLFQECL